VTPERLCGHTDIAPALVSTDSGLERIADVPVYFTDPLVRRAESLQMTADARPPKVSANRKTLAQVGLKAGDKARVRQKVDSVEASALLEVALDDGLPDGVLRVPAGHAATSTLGAMFGAITVERA
jgi:NADH-quinone oxidoreductase subunit G